MVVPQGAAPGSVFQVQLQLPTAPVAGASARTSSRPRRKGPTSKSSAKAHYNSRSLPLEGEAVEESWVYEMGVLRVRERADPFI